MRKVDVAELFLELTQIIEDLVTQAAPTVYSKPLLERLENFRQHQEIWMEEPE